MSRLTWIIFGFTAIFLIAFAMSHPKMNWFPSTEKVLVPIHALGQCGNNSECQDNARCDQATHFCYQVDCETDPLDECTQKVVDTASRECFAVHFPLCPNRDVQPEDSPDIENPTQPNGGIYDVAMLSTDCNPNMDDPCEEVLFDAESKECFRSRKVNCCSGPRDDKACSMAINP